MAYLSIYFFAFVLEMSSGNSQLKGKHRTEEGITATRDRMKNWQVIPKRNTVRADIMVAPLDFIAKMI